MKATPLRGHWPTPAICWSERTADSAAGIELGVNRNTLRLAARAHPIRQRKDRRFCPGRLSLFAVRVGGVLRSEIVAVGGEIGDEEEGQGCDAADENNPWKPFIRVRTRQAVGELQAIHLSSDVAEDKIETCKEGKWLNNGSEAKGTCN